MPESFLKKFFTPLFPFNFLNWGMYILYTFPILFSSNTYIVSEQKIVPPEWLKTNVLQQYN